MIYLDHNSTTPISPEVLEAMMPYMTEEWGNPSSSYKFGSKLKGDIEAARKDVAGLLNARASEIIFTSGGSESNNAAIQGALLSNSNKRHIITSNVEHSSVLNLCKLLETRGYRVTYLPVDTEGLIDPAQVKDAISEDTAIVSLIWANNETGVLFPVDEISEICRSGGIAFHLDAVQLAGKAEINVKTLSVDFLSLTGHKLNGPKGIGALYIRKNSGFAPLIVGGHQERNMRGGTENVAGIIGLGKAVEISRKKIEKYDLIRELRDRLEESLLNEFPFAERNGHKDKRLPNTSSITFKGIESEALLILLDQAGICASSGSACLADSDEPSHVIHAMTKSSERSRQSVRFSFGTTNTKAEVLAATEAICQCVSTLTD